MDDSTPISRQEFFDRAAGEWDARVATDDFMRRLRSEVAGLEVEPDETVLDLGCGTGNLTVVLLRECLSAHGHVLALDFSPVMLRHARAKVGPDSRVSWLEADAAAVPAPDHGVDRVICFSTWPHFPEPAAVAAEMARVLKPGGRLDVLHVDGRDTINHIHAAAGGAVAADLLPPATELAELLERSGFTVKQSRDDDDGYLVSAVRLTSGGSAGGS